jgi:hypothetical protein
MKQICYNKKYDREIFIIYLVFKYNNNGFLKELNTGMPKREKKINFCLGFKTFSNLKSVVIGACRF